MQVDQQTRGLTAAVDGGVDSLKQVLQHLGDANIAVVDVGLRRPTLDDVFLTLTGHDTEAGDGDAAESDDRIDVREKEAVR